MKKQLLYLFVLAIFAFNAKAQTISIIGSTTPNADWATDIDMQTTDNITYRLYGITLTAATDPNTTGMKFRQNHDWGTNWGNSNFPSGTAVLNGANIRTQANTYDITFNRSNGTYTFIPATFTPVGIWGPAVDSQNGFAGNDVDMLTTDGITYTLSGFNFSSGTAYFRLYNDNLNTMGSVSFPTGAAVAGGPSIQVTGGEWFVTFNKNTGAYSFAYPSIGILGTSLNGFTAEDVDMTTSDGFRYEIAGLPLSNGEVKFRKDNLWTSNWGSSAFPDGTGTQGGANIPVQQGVYNIYFHKSSGNYSFQSVLSIGKPTILNISIYPNPTSSIWNFNHTETIDTIELFDVTGKMIQTFSPNTNQFQVNASSLSNVIYFVKIKSGLDFAVRKIVKN